MILRIPGSTHSVDIKNNHVVGFKNKKIVTLEINGIMVTRKVSWYKHLSILNINMPSGYHDKILLLEFHPHVPFGRSREYTQIPVFSEAVATIVHGVEYRLVARSPSHMVSEDGKVMDINGRMYSTHVSDSGYTISCVRFPIVKTDKKTIYIRKVSVHKLIGLAWVDNDDYCVKNILDHLDRDKTNNHKDNLGWVSNRTNVMRGQSNGDVDEYLVLDNGTKDVHQFESMHQVSEYIGRSLIDVKNSPLRHGKYWTGANGTYQISKQSYSWRWTDAETKLIKYIITIDDNRTKFMCIADISEYYNLKYRHYEIETVLHMLKDKYPLSKVTISKPLIFNNIEVMTVRNGEVMLFHSIKDVIAYTGIPKSTVSARLRRGQCTRVTSGYLLRKETEEPWVLDHSKLEKPTNHPKQISIICGDKTTTYESINQASAFLNASYKTIKSLVNPERNILRHGKAYKIISK